METKSPLCQYSQEVDSFHHLIDGPINIEQFKTKNNSESGAVICFEGIIRGDDVNGKKVEHINYEVYFPVAEKILAQIEEESKSNFEVHDVKIYHSFGKVKTNECSLLVIVKSKHRKNGFKCCIDIVDRIKAEAPVWKQEYYNDGSYNWVRCNHH